MDVQDLHATGDFVVDCLSQPQNGFRRPNTPICIQILQEALYSLQGQKYKTINLIYKAD